MNNATTAPSARPAAAATGLAAAVADTARQASAGARVLLLSAHPDLRASRVNSRLLGAARRLPGDHLEVRDLYQLYPDFAIDVAAEQAALARADLIVWQHPIQWYAMPALMKLWLDEVFSHGWAYGQGGGALAGKSLWLAVSTGGGEAGYSPTGYNRYFFDAFLPPYEQTAALCGLRFLPPLVLHGAHAASDAELDAHASTFAQRLAGWPDPAAWPELAELDSCPTCVVPAADRPADERPAEERAAAPAAHLMQEA